MRDIEPILDYKISPYMVAVVNNFDDPATYARLVEMYLPLSREAKTGRPVGHDRYNFPEFTTKMENVALRMVGRVAVFSEALAVTESVAWAIIDGRARGMSSVFWTTQLESLGRTDGLMHLQHDIDSQYIDSFNHVLRTVFGNDRVVQDCSNSNKAIAIKLI